MQTTLIAVILAGARDLIAATDAFFLPAYADTMHLGTGAAATLHPREAGAMFAPAYDDTMHLATGAPSYLEPL